MKTTINILLLMTGFASTLIAFGGRTWVEGTRPVLERITLRGWLALIALGIATSLGISKEIISQRDEARQRTAAESERIKSATREADLQAKLALEGQDLDDLKRKLVDARALLGTTSQSLSDANRSLADNKHVVEGIAAIDQKMATEVAQSRGMIQNSEEVIESIDDIQHDLRNVALISALSRPQTNFEVELDIPVSPRGFSDEANPESATDLFFPEWRKLGIQGSKAMIGAVDLRSDEGKWGGSMGAALWNTRESPEEFSGVASANQYTTPFKQGTEKGDDEITATLWPGDDAEHSAFRFRVIFWKTTVMNQWLSSFHKGTKVVSVTYFLRPRLARSDREKLVALWTHMFAEKGRFLIPLLDMDNFRLVYPLQRVGVQVTEEQNAEDLSMSYEITAAPTFEAEEILETQKAPPRSINDLSH